MGFLGGDNDRGSNDIMDQQVKQNQAELEAKKQSLYQTRLDIIKSQGQQSFTANRSGRADGAAKNDTSFGGNGFLNNR